MAFWVAAAAAVVSAAVSAYAAYETGEQQQAVAKYNAKLARNRAIAEQQAAQLNAEQRAEQNRRLLAAQRVRLNASGVDSSAGSPLLLQMDSAEQAALEIGTIKYGGETRSRGLQAEENLQRFYGAAARRNQAIGVSGAILTGTAKAGGYAYSAYNKQGGGSVYD